jgi:hypothetical protein
MSNLTESWLQNNTVRRCVLVVLGYYDVGTTSEKTEYISNTGYTTGNADTTFKPVLSQGLQFTESLSITGGISMSMGDIEVINPNGDLDSWLLSTSRIWVNRTVQVYYGDPTWTTANYAAIATTFELVFNGLISDISARSRETINFKVIDKMERLNYPVTENKLGTYGTWPTQTNQDSIKPLIFGEVHNITPLQVDPSQLMYQLCADNAELLVEIRDNGVPIHTSGGITGATITDSTATVGGTTFKLNAPLAGTITVSAQGVKNSMNLSTGALISGTYNNKIANLIALITTQYGSPITGMKLDGTTELDLTNLSAFDTANTQPVGVFVNGNDTVLSVCQNLAASIAAQLYFTRYGQLQLLRLGVTSGTPVITTITDNDIMYHSLSVNARTEVVSASTIGYAKNWTVQTGLLTYIPQAHKDMFATEWMTVTSTIDTTTKNLYKLTADPKEKDTWLITTSDATTEANRLKDFYNDPHTVYTFIGTPRMQLLKLGQAVTLTHNRFGLSGGVSCQVVSLGINWSTGQVNVGVLTL